MIRNYALTFAAVTLRIWLPLFMLLLGLERFELSYAIIAWLACGSGYLDHCRVVYTTKTKQKASTHNT